MAVDIDIDKLTEVELVALNRRVVERIRGLRQAKTYRELAKFGVGDRVSFDTTDGRHIEGLVIRVNKKTVSVDTDDEHQWNVAPSHLRKIRGPDLSTPLFPEDSDDDDTEPSQKKFDQSRAQVEVWWKEFASSGFFRGLSKGQQEEAGHVISAFGDFMYNYSGYMPSKWTDSALYEICVDVIPRKVSASDEFFAAISPILVAFFGFLADKGYQKNALLLARRAHESGDQIVKCARERSNWGSGKALLDKAMKAGVDITNRMAMQRFVREQNLEIAAQRAGLDTLLPPRQEPIRNDTKVGRNEACPCGSGRKYKKCCERSLRLVQLGH